jgi:hypothetical protein
MAKLGVQVQVGSGGHGVGRNANSRNFQFVSGRSVLRAVKRPASDRPLSVHIRVCRFESGGDATMLGRWSYKISKLLENGRPVYGRHRPSETLRDIYFTVVECRPRVQSNLQRHPLPYTAIRPLLDGLPHVPWGCAAPPANGCPSKPTLPASRLCPVLYDAAVGLLCMAMPAWANARRSIPADEASVQVAVLCQSRRLGAAAAGPPTATVQHGAAYAHSALLQQTRRSPTREHRTAHADAAPSLAASPMPPPALLLPCATQHVISTPCSLPCDPPHLTAVRSAFATCFVGVRFAMRV